MKHAGRWLFNLAAMGSLLLLGIILILSASSYGGAYNAHLLTRAGDRYDARIENGRISFYHLHNRPLGHIDWDARWYPKDDSDGDSADDVKTFLGFGYLSIPIPNKLPFQVAVVPKWMFIAALLIVPALRLKGILRQIRSARLVAQNRCPACGYDLRATPERCPECGAFPSTSAKVTA